MHKPATSMNDHAAGFAYSICSSADVWVGAIIHNKTGPTEFPIPTGDRSGRSCFQYGHPRQMTPFGSHGQPEFPGRLLLRTVHRDKSVYPLAGVKPERRAQMREIERSWSRDGREEVGLAKIQRQIP